MYLCCFDAGGAQLLEILLRVYPAQGVITDRRWAHQLLHAVDDVAVLQPLDNLFELAAVKRVQLFKSKKSDVVVWVIHEWQL